MERPIQSDSAKLTNAQIEKGFDFIKNYYKNKDIDLLYITYDQNIKSGLLKKEKLTNNITKWVGNYKKKNAIYDYEVDIKLIVNSLCKFVRLKKTFYVKTKEIIMKIIFVLINCLIPIPNWRQSVRKRLRTIKY